GLNKTLDTAKALAPVQVAKANTFKLAGRISSSADVDWYKITPNAPDAFNGTLYVGATAPVDGVLPTIGVFDASGQNLSAAVVMNENGVFEVQLPCQATGTTYYLRVASAVSSGSRSTGSYTLSATLAPVAATQFDGLATSTITNDHTTVYSTMTVDGNRLSQFSLSAQAGSATAPVAVRVTLFDCNGRAVFTRTVLAGQPLVTGEIWLPSGTFTVVFNAATKDGSALPNLAFE